MATTTVYGGRINSVSWPSGEEGGYSIKFGYAFLSSLSLNVIHNQLLGKALTLLWKLNIPFRIKVFGWKWFWNRTTIKEKLTQRRLSLNSDNNCLFCREALETLYHLPSYCDTVKKVWSDIASWARFTPRGVNSGWRNFMQ